MTGVQTCALPIYHPLMVGKKYYITAEIEKKRGKITYSVAYVYDEAGNRVASSKAKQIEIEDDG